MLREIDMNAFLQSSFWFEGHIRQPSKLKKNKKFSEQFFSFGLEHGWHAVSNSGGENNRLLLSGTEENACTKVQNECWDTQRKKQGFLQSHKAENKD